MIKSSVISFKKNIIILVIKIGKYIDKWVKQDQIRMILKTFRRVTPSSVEKQEDQSLD